MCCLERYPTKEGREGMVGVCVLKAVGLGHDIKMYLCEKEFRSNNNATHATATSEKLLLWAEGMRGTRRCHFCNVIFLGFYYYFARHFPCFYNRERFTMIPSLYGTSSGNIKSVIFMYYQAS